MIYIRPAQHSDPVRPENTAEIERLYQKRELIQTRTREAFSQTWFRSRNWPLTTYLIACPITIKEDLIPGFDSASLQIIRRIVGLLVGGCGAAMVAANEFRCQNTKGVYTARITRYGLVEELVASAQPQDKTVLGPRQIESHSHEFLHAVSEFYKLWGYSGLFDFTFGVIAREKQVVFSAGGSSQGSEPCEKDSFTVERRVSLYGDQGIVDFDSRKRILEGMSREYLANFGTRLALIEQMGFLAPKDVPWK